MKNRIELLREYIDAIILNVPDDFDRRCAYSHLYGVAQACALIAQRRGENAELATMAGMLHDLNTYKTGDSAHHAERGAILARQVLDELQIATSAETDMICSAIHNHSSKALSFSAFEEVLIDADVMQHCLYNPSFPVAQHEKARFARLAQEFGFSQPLMCNS